jgi:hypothetical protein
MVGVKKRPRVIDGRASVDREAALAHAADLAVEVRDGVVDLGGRKRRAASDEALLALINLALEAAQDRNLEDSGLHVKLALRGAHETDVNLAVLLARRVCSLLSSSRGSDEADGT